MNKKLPRNHTREIRHFQALKSNGTRMSARLQITITVLPLNNYGRNNGFYDKYKVLT